MSLLASRSPDFPVDHVIVREIMQSDDWIASMEERIASTAASTALSSEDKLAMLDHIQAATRKIKECINDGRMLEDGARIRWTSDCGLDEPLPKPQVSANDAADDVPARFHAIAPRSSSAERMPSAYAIRASSPSPRRHDGNGDRDRYYSARLYGDRYVPSARTRNSSPLNAPDEMEEDKKPPLPFIASKTIDGNSLVKVIETLQQACSRLAYQQEDDRKIMSPDMSPASDLRDRIYDIRDDVRELDEQVYRMESRNDSARRR